MTEHDRAIDHGNGHWWALSCPKCSQEYAAHVAAAPALADPFRAPLTDEEPWRIPVEPVEPEPEDREWSRWGVVVAVAAMCLIVAYHLARGR